MLLTTAKGKPMLAHMRMRVLVLLAAALVGCAAIPDGAVVLQTHPVFPVCQAARVGGTLVADPTYGLAFKNGGKVQGVVWPHGYSARRESGVVFLIDPSGRTVAREGDRIESAGVWNDNDVAFPCGALTVNPPSQ
jgi:hypothetical protein